MLDAAVGLTEVKTKHLKQLLSLVHRGEFTYPLDIAELARTGLQHCAPALLAQLRKLDEPGVRAVLITVLAERLPANQKRRAASGATAEI
jgi:hypothetical protein